MSVKQKRNRSINWEEEEKQLFRTVLKEFASVIENKALDNNTNKLKSNAWEKVHKKFNELNGRLRSLSQLKIQWKTMKINKKNIKKIKRTSKAPSCSAKGNYVDTMIDHTKFLKDREHEKRMEILEVELKIQKEKLISATIEREIFEIRRAKELK